MRPKRNKPYIGASNDPPSEFSITAHLISVSGSDHLTESDWCWCQPTLLNVPPNGQIILHRRTMDDRAA